MNVFTFTGRLGRDAEVRHTPNGHAVCGFVVANDVGFGDRKTTNWIKCDLWGKRAEGGLPQYLTKGVRVAVSGELTLDEFQKRDGSQGAALKVRVIDVDLMDSKGGGQHDGQQQPRQQAPQQPEPANEGAGFDDSIPFAPMAGI